jgi:transposase InsO family protein
MLGVSRAGYYRWLSRSESIRKIENRLLLFEIRAAHRASRGSYGSPRVHSELSDRGVLCGKNRVARLMRVNNIRAKQRRKFKATTDSKHSLPVAENVLGRNFEAKRPNEKWVTDITYIPTKEGWLYLAVIIDLYSRLIVGWGMGERLAQVLVMDALKMALLRRNPSRGLLHHSDRGSQYAGDDYQNILAERGIICSMSRKGDCYDNAVAESFFHTLKTELVRHRSYETRSQAKADLFEYMEVFYNRKRRHSSLGYKSPAEYENLANVA